MKKITLFLFSILSMYGTELNEYCANNISASNAMGVIHNVSVCITSKDTFNKYELTDIIISLVSARVIEELLTKDGKDLLKEEIISDIKSKNDIYYSKFEIVPYER